MQKKHISTLVLEVTYILMKNRGKRVCVRVPTAQGKTGKMAKKIPCQGKLREFGSFCQNTGNLVVNSLILKVKDILKFAVKISPSKKKEI